MLFLEPKRLYRAARGEVPEDDYTIELGQANVVRTGDMRMAQRIATVNVRRDGPTAEDEAILGKGAMQASRAIVKGHLAATPEKLKPSAPGRLTSVAARRAPAAA